jgi:hypothetical protein
MCDVRATCEFAEELCSGELLTHDSELRVRLLRLPQLHHKFRRSYLGLHSDLKEIFLWL